MQQKFNHDWAWAFPGISLVLVAVVVWALVQNSPHSPPPKLSKLPGFILQERSGLKVSSGTLAGKVWLADFIYVHCTGSCPAMTASMKRFQGEWKEKGLYLVSVTVDPKRDTLATLRQYADEAQADPRQWLFLRGSSKAVFDLAKGFKVTDAKDQSDFIHSDDFVLVGPGGWIRGYYDNTNEADISKLQRDLKGLLASKT